MRILFLTVNVPVALETKCCLRSSTSTALLYMHCLFSTIQPEKSSHLRHAVDWTASIDLGQVVGLFCGGLQVTWAITGRVGQNHIYTVYIQWCAGVRYGMVRLWYAMARSDHIYGKILYRYGMVREAGKLPTLSKKSFWIIFLHMLRLTYLHCKIKVHFLRGKADKKLGWKGKRRSFDRQLNPGPPFPLLKDKIWSTVFVRFEHIFSSTA